MELIEPGETQVRFDTLSRRLTVDKTPDGLYAMDFPAYALSPVPVTDAMEPGHRCAAIAAYMGRDLLCVMENENLVRTAQPIWRRSRSSPSAQFSCLRTRSN